MTRNVQEKQDLEETAITLTKLPFDFVILRYALAAAEFGGFRKAAEQLGTHAATVSRGVRRLEDDLGVSLFDRVSAGVRLTHAGRRFTKMIVPCLVGMREAVHTAGAAGRAETGVVRIGVITTLAGELRRLIAEYRMRNRGVRLEIHEGSRRDHLTALRAGRLDAVFVTGSADVPGCEIIELWTERVHVAMSHTHPLSRRHHLDWGDIKDERFAVTGAAPGSEVRDYIIRRVANYSNYPSIEVRPVSQATLMQMVGLGEGITVVSAGWTELAIADVCTVPLVADEDEVPFSAVWSRTNDNPAFRRLLSLAKSFWR